MPFNSLAQGLHIKYRTRKFENNFGFKIVLDYYVSKQVNTNSRSPCVRYADNFFIVCESKEDYIECKHKLCLILKN